MGKDQQNEVFFDKDKGIIWNIHHGDQDAETILGVVSNIKTIIDNNDLSESEVRIAVDLSDHSSTTSGSRKAAAKALKRIPYYKIAIFGLDMYMENIAKFVINAISEENRIRIFDSKKEAIKWLVSNDS